ncbi:MAG: tRNA (guanine(10)-N(2))-dimethyltransferase [Thaumarchaeota archaeon]|nr:tRNA (guanine(10)-N(2))-dimethyltransferase [Nitrososphaerota archaeon]MCL5316663.1 tRNA (guanine(10)-N(2))-dimethyltransferase [Nitrososphaerota archaeon]
MKARGKEADAAINNNNSGRQSEDIVTINESEIAEITEGDTTLYVPKSSLDATVPPKAPAFYNPYATLNRDLTVAAYRVFAERRSGTVTMADVLAGTGARGVRVAVEVPRINEIYINDGNPRAIELAKRSAAVNKVADKCKFSVQDACRLLMEHSAYKSRFNIVDIDPFGSPAPYLDCALRALEKEGILSATATDTAALCGVYPDVAYRRYNGYSLRTEYCHETGIRLLLGAAAHQAMRLELGISPIFVHRTRHYLRIYVSVHLGAGWVDRTYSQIGLIQHCFKCSYRSTAEPLRLECPKCGATLKRAGPLWIGELYDKEFICTMAEDCQKHMFREGVKMLAAAAEETGMPPTYFTADQVAADIGVRSPSLDHIIAHLREGGFRASRSALNPKGIKTDAPAETVRRVVNQIS